MVKTLGLALLAVTFAARDARAVHDADVSAAELKCQAALTKAIVRFVAAKGTCVSKCIAGARAVTPLNTEADCSPPFGGKTLACITDPRRGAEAKAIAAIDSACITVPAKTDCPECYSARSGSTDCSSHGHAMIVSGPSNPPWPSQEQYVDSFLFLFCSDNPNTAAENVCEQYLFRAFGKFIGCKYKCYDRCNVAMHRGTIPNGSCNPPLPADPVTVACLFDSIRGCNAKGIAAVDKACFVPPADAPECYSFTSSNIMSLFETWTDGQIPGFYCGSPSGAFLAD